MVAFLSLVVAGIAVVASIGIAVFSVRNARRNAAEARHSERREEAYDQILAAGDAAWFYRTQTAVAQAPEEVDRETIHAMLSEAESLLERGLDILEKHSRVFDKIGLVVIEWVDIAFVREREGAKSYENARDVLVNLRRQEAGLRANTSRAEEQTFYERVMAGYEPQRLPEGIMQVIRFDNDETLIQGHGEEFGRVFQQMINYPKELKLSREVARRRLAEWRRSGVWEHPPTDEESTRGVVEDD